jgi:hypothetical protein
LAHHELVSFVFAPGKRYSKQKQKQKQSKAKPPVVVVALRVKVSNGLQNLQM